MKNINKITTHDTSPLTKNSPLYRKGSEGKVTLDGWKGWGKKSKMTMGKRGFKLKSTRLTKDLKISIISQIYGVVLKTNLQMLRTVLQVQRIFMVI
jgi:hypothetical protein